MVRVKDTSTGIVHFVNPAHADCALCTYSLGRDLLGNWAPIGKPTTEKVTCPLCAKVVCAIRNEPYNTLDESVEDETMMSGIYAAVEPPTEHNQNEGAGNDQPAVARADRSNIPSIEQNKPA